MGNIITNQLCHPQTVFALLEGRQNGWVAICFERRLVFQFNSIWIINGFLCWRNLIFATLTNWWFLLILNILNLTLSNFVSCPFLYNIFIFILPSIPLKLFFRLFYNIIRFIASLSEIWMISDLIKASRRL